MVVSPQKQRQSPTRQSPTGKKAVKRRSRSPVKSPSGPSTKDMVNSAISSLGDRKGSSLAAIKKYIEANYTCDVERRAPFIKAYLKKAVAAGSLKRTTGVGASGSFKIVTSSSSTSSAGSKGRKNKKVKAKKSSSGGVGGKAKAPRARSASAAGKKKSKKTKKAKKSKKATQKANKKAAKQGTAKKTSAKKSASKTNSKKGAKKAAKK